MWTNWIMGQKRGGRGTKKERMLKVATNVQRGKVRELHEKLETADRYNLSCRKLNCTDETITITHLQKTSQKRCSAEKSVQHKKVQVYYLSSGNKNDHRSRNTHRLAHGRETVTVSQSVGWLIDKKPKKNSTHGRQHFKKNRQQWKKP